MIRQLRDAPWGVTLFLAYATVILAIIGLSMRYVVDLAIGAPLSFPGLIVMILLAYVIFTITLVLQRKEVSRILALGLSSLVLPIAAFGVLGGAPVVGVFFGTLGALLFRGLTRPSARAWLFEP